MVLGDVRISQSWICGCSAAACLVSTAFYSQSVEIGIAVRNMLPAAFFLVTLFESLSCTD